MASIITMIATPVVTYLAMLVANLIRKTMGGSPLISTLLVPVVGGAVTWLATVVTPATPWEVSLVVSLASVWLKKLIDDVQAPAGA